MKYAIVIEKTGTGFSGYLPDLPGIGVAGETRPAVRRKHVARRRSFILRRNAPAENVFPVPTLSRNMSRPRDRLLSATPHVTTNMTPPTNPSPSYYNYDRFVSPKLERDDTPQRRAQKDQVAIKNDMGKCIYKVANLSGIKPHRALSIECFIRNNDALSIDESTGMMEHFLKNRSI